MFLALTTCWGISCIGYRVQRGVSPRIAPFYEYGIVIARFILRFATRSQVMSPATTWDRPSLPGKITMAITSSNAPESNCGAFEYQTGKATSRGSPVEGLLQKICYQSKFNESNVRNAASSELRRQHVSCSRSLLQSDHAYRMMAQEGATDGVL